MDDVITLDLGLWRGVRLPLSVMTVWGRGGEVNLLSVGIVTIPGESADAASRRPYKDPFVVGTTACRVRLTPSVDCPDVR